MKLPKISENKLSMFGIIYFLSGIVFAFYFAWYYNWPAYAYFSPGFFMVVFTWPFQALGLLNDISYWGLGGKPI